MITNKELEEMEIKSTLSDKYTSMIWGSRKDIQRLIKEIKKLRKKTESCGVKE